MSRDPELKPCYHGKAHFAEHDLIEDAEDLLTDVPDIEMCHNCVHEEECAEIDGRQEGRFFGAECHFPGVEPQYERRKK